MPPRRRALALLAAVLLGAAGCDLPLGSEPLAGTYALASVGGNPLPVALFDNAENGRLEILADTLRMWGDGTGSVVTASRYRSPGATAAGPVERHETAFGYRVRGGRLEISFACPPNALCAAAPHLTGRGDRESLRLAPTNTPPNPAVHLYRRVDP